MAKLRKKKRKSGPIGNEEILKARNAWVMRTQRDIDPSVQAPGWKLFKDKNTNILKCKGRVGGYTPTHIDGELFAEKRVTHTKHTKHTLPYVECDGWEQQVLKQGEKTYPCSMTLTMKDTRAKDEAWKRWKSEYLHSLLQSQQVNNKVVEVAQIGDIVLVVGEEKNRGKWKKGKFLCHVRRKDGVTREVALLHIN